MATTVRAQIDETIKERASAILSTVGLTVSDAFRLMMVRIVADGQLPFHPLVPNAETIEAIEAARRGDLSSASSVEDLVNKLNAQD